MANAGVSDSVHGFVQRCQASLSAFADQDYAAQVSGLWDALDAFPAGTLAEAEQVTAVVSTARLAMGFFRATNRPAIAPVRVRDSRAHVNGALRIVRSEYASREICLSEIARRLELSQFHLSRELKHHTHHTFPTHLNSVRLLAAIDRLRARPAHIAQVATGVGYPNTGELDRQFKTRFNLSPRRFERLIALAPRDRVK